MKRYTIKINNSENSNNGSNNASKNLDNLILSNLIKMNPYLGKKDSTLDAMLKEAGINNTEDDHIIINNYDNRYLLKDYFDNDEFTKAAKFLSTYTPTKKSYIINKTLPITFFEDEIQIGYDLIPLHKLASPEYYTTFTPDIKKAIINIYINIS